MDLSSWYGREERSDVRIVITVPETVHHDDKRRRCSLDAEQSSGADLRRAAAKARACCSGGTPAHAAHCCSSIAAPQRRRRVLAEVPGHLIVLEHASAYVATRMLSRWSGSAAGSGSSNSSGGGSHSLEIALDDASEAEAADLLLRTMYATADVAAPLRATTRRRLPLWRGAAADLAASSGGGEGGKNGGGDEDNEPAGEPPSQALLLRVLFLADRLQADASAAAAARELAARAPLEWPTVAAAFELPPACAASADAAPLVAAAARELLARLGDLDAAWADPARAAQLRALPFGAIRALLADARTSAASENTAFYTAAAWLGAQRGGGAPDERAALAALIRAPHLTPLFRAGVAARSGWLLEAAPGRALLLLEAGPRDAHAGENQQEPAPPPAWRLPPRPASAAPRALELEWRVPLAALRLALERALAEGGRDAGGSDSSCCGSDAGASSDSDAGAAAAAAAELPSLRMPGRPRPFQGLEFELRLHGRRRANGGATVGVYVFARPPPGVCAGAGCGGGCDGLPSCESTGEGDAAVATAAAAAVTAAVRIDCAHYAREFKRVEFPAAPRGCGGRGHGFADAFGLGAQARWDEGAWRRAGLVAPDGCVRVRALVRDVA